MINFEVIHKKELWRLLELCMENDDYVLKNYHFEVNSKEQLILDFYKRLDECEQTVQPTVCLKMKVFGEDAGYLIIADHLIFSFAIAKKFRNKNVLYEWADKIRQFFFTEFYCTLQDNNKRAIKCLQKLGFEIAGISNNIVVLSNKNLCQ